MTDIIGCRRPTARVLLCVALLTACAVIGLASVARAATGTYTYSATETVALPPASTFAGSGGGDGWAVAMTPTAVYNVFHHNSALTLACHLQTDASPCWAAGTKTITDASGNNFSTSGHPGLYIDQNSGKLYVYATRQDGTAGVVCVDTTQPDTVSDPFCGFTPLSGVGEAQGAMSTGYISNPVQAGTKWYAVNYFSGTPSGSEDELMCFDLTTFGPCASQPYALALGAASPSVTTGSWPPSPSIALIGSQIVIPITVNGNDELACFDAAAGGNCTGSWPVTVSSGYVANNGAPFPLMDSNGNLTGLCLPTGTDPCYTLAGASASTPAGMPAVIGGSDGWNGPGLTFGPRVYVPDGNSNDVECFDYSTGAACAGFPKTFQNLSYLYTVNPDPQRPTCIWVNADGGSAQIQNFDAYTGGACGQGQTRVLASGLVAPGSVCMPATYTSLQVLAPAPGSYTSGSVQFEDPDGNQIPGIPTQNLDATGTVSLTGLNLNTNLGLPQFVITLNGTSGSASSVTVKLTWTGTGNPACAAPGITVTPPPSTPPVVIQPQADLVLAQSVSKAKLFVGQKVTFVMTVANHGPDTASSVVLVDTLPAGFKLVSAQAAQGSCTGTSTVSCALGTLANGASTKVTLVTIAPTRGAFTNKAAVVSSVIDPNLANNAANAHTIVAGLYCQARVPFVTYYDGDDAVRTIEVFINGHLVQKSHHRNLSRRVWVSNLRADIGSKVKVMFILTDGVKVIQTLRVSSCAAGPRQRILQGEGGEP